MKLFKIKGISKKYAIKAALYRRLARGYITDHDFSLESLRQLHQYESRGLIQIEGGFDAMKKTNGYAYGKWLRDIQMSDIVEGIKQGDFCKAEFLSTAIERIHNTKPLETVIVCEWFPWREYVADLLKKDKQ